MKHTFAAAAATLCCLGTSAQTSIRLQHHPVTGSHALDALGELGQEASAVTYARDRGTLLFVGDEGLGVVEITRTGQPWAARSSTGPARPAATTTPRASPTWTATS